MEKRTGHLLSIIVGALAFIAINLAFVCPALSICGDEIRDPGEGCDDAEFPPKDGDGCSATCTIEEGWNCFLTPSLCGPICGDGLIRGHEECDDGNLSSGDGCSPNCAVQAFWGCTTDEPSVCSSCGDGFLLESIGEECDDGNEFGGDGCAQNCTHEYPPRSYLIDPARSWAKTQFVTQLVELGMSGSLQFIFGGPNKDGTIPFVVPSEYIYFGRISVPGLACACVRNVERPDQFGPGNGGVGHIGCGESFFASAIEVTSDHNIGLVNHCVGGDSDDQACVSDTDCPGGYCLGVSTCTGPGGAVEPPDGLHPDVCNGPKVVEFSPSGPRGSMFIGTNIGFDLIFDGGSCCDVGIDPDCTDPTGEKGADGIACSEDDPGATVGLDVPGFTGPSSITIKDLNNVEGVTLGPGSMCGAEPCVAEVEGEPFDCDAVLNDPTGGLDTGSIVFAFPIFDYPVFGDSLVTVKLVPRAAEEPCPGDCNGNGTVTIDEMVRGVNIALGTSSADECPAFDRNLDGSVTIDELVAAVTNALDGCPVS